MRTYIRVLLLILFVGCCGVMETYAQTSAETLRIYGLKSAPKVMREWSVSEEILANDPGFNPADYLSVEKAIYEGMVDEMSTHIIRYDFTPDGKVQDWIEYAGNVPVKIQIQNMPGVFNIGMKNGIPQTFILDEKGFQEDLDNGQIFLDAYENGLSNFAVSYDESGKATRLEGVAMPYFGGRMYVETYSNYKFDSHGNWTKRTVSTPYDTIIQYRAYEY